MSTRPNRFKTPDRLTSTSRGMDEWVQQGREPEVTGAASTKPAKGKQARLTIDLPPELHARFKAACALQQTRMVDAVTQFIKKYTETQINGKAD